MRAWVLLAALTVTACSNDKAGKEEGARGDPPPTVSVATVQSRALASGIDASGVLIPREEAAIGAELAGYRVQRVLADEGSYVRRGQALAVLDPTLIQEQIRQAEVTAERARSEYGRVADLRGKGVIADETIAQRGFEARSAASQLRDLQNRRARLTLRAPVSGLVLSRALRPGDVTGSASTDPYFRIARDGIFELEAEVPESEFGRVRTGLPVPVKLASGETLSGRVRFISPRVDQQTKLGRIRITLPPSRALRAGGFATARLGATNSGGPAVPERAIQFTADGAYVLVVDGQRRAQRVAVRTGERGGGWVELVQGPGVGARVILGGAGLVVPGETVRIAGAAR